MPWVVHPNKNKNTLEQIIRIYSLVARSSREKARVQSYPIIIENIERRVRHYFRKEFIPRCCWTHSKGRRLKHCPSLRLEINPWMTSSMSQLSRNEKLTGVQIVQTICHLDEIFSNSTMLQVKTFKSLWLDFNTIIQLWMDKLRIRRN